MAFYQGAQEKGILDRRSRQERAQRLDSVWCRHDMGLQREGGGNGRWKEKEGPSLESSPKLRNMDFIQ